MSNPKLFAAAGKLKRVKRQGWLDAKIPREEAESVADHSFGVAFIVAFLAGEEAGAASTNARPPSRKNNKALDISKAVRMALLHDLAEAEIGDLTPRSGISRGRKARLEEEAVRALGNEVVLSLWREFEEGRSPEARLVREADVLERVLQAREYASGGRPETGLSHFWKGWKRRVRSPALRALAEGRGPRRCRIAS